MSKKTEKNRKNFLQSLSSLRVTVILLAGIGVICALGTVIPLRSDYASFRHFLIGGVGRFMISTGLDEPFSSNLFMFVLGIFAVHLLICTVVRLPGLTKRALTPQVKTDPEALKSMSLWAEGVSQVDAEEVLKKEGYTFFSQEQGGNKGYLGIKGMYAPFGPHVTHVGILLIFLGGFIGQYFGYEGFGEASAGSSFQVYDGEYYRLTEKMKKNFYIASFYRDLEREKILLEEDVKAYEKLMAEMDSIETSLKNLAKTPQFSVRVLDAQETKYEGSTDVKDWTSVLEVVKGGKPVFKQAIEVNVPLSYEGVNLFQHSFSHRSHEAISKELTLKKGQVYTDPDNKDIEIEILDFYRDFSVNKGADGGMNVFSKSREFNNPAIKVRLGASENSRGGVYLFTGQPGSIHDDPSRPWFVKFTKLSSTDTSVNDDDLGFVCSLYKRETVPVTGVSISSDPGTTVVWIGCFLMMVGMGMCFYIEKKEIWIVRTPCGKLVVAGRAFRFPALFPDEFYELSRALGIPGSSKEGDVH